MKRLLHWLIGHAFEIQTHCYCAGTNQAPAYMSVEEQKKCWGFTSILMICSCGKIRSYEVVGRHDPKALAKDPELQELRKLL